MNKEVKQLGPGNHKTDLFNLNPIFLVKHKSSKFFSKNCFVRSWEEALELNGSPEIKDINLDYICSFISKVPNTEISPYKNIVRLPRSSNVLIRKDGSYKCSYINPFEYKSNSLGEKEFKEQLREIFFEQISSEINNYNGSIGVEQSGGIASNLVVGSLLKI